MDLLLGAPRIKDLGMKATVIPGHIILLNCLLAIMPLSWRIPDDELMTILSQTLNTVNIGRTYKSEYQ